MARIAALLHASILGIGAALPLGGGAAIAGGDEAEAKAVCLTLGSMMKNPATNIDTMQAFIGTASNHQMTPDAIGAITGFVSRLTAGASAIEGPFFLAEKNYADALHRAWFLLIRNGRPIYMACESVKTQGQWEFTHFDIDTNRDKVPLP